MSPRTKLSLQTSIIIILAFFAILFAWPKGPDLIRDEVKLHLGLDLAGGAHLVYEADVANIPEEDRGDAVEGTRDVIERRVNAFGVGEPVVQTNKTSDGYRIIIELPGVTDVGTAIALIGETPVLEFKEPGGQVSLTDEEKQTAIEFNQGQLEKAEATLADLVAATDDEFAARAAAESEEPGAADSGGDLDFQSPGLFVPEFEDILFGDLENDTTYREVVRTVFGYHIIRRIEERCVDTVLAIVVCNREDPSQTTQVRGRHILYFTQDEEFNQGTAAWDNTKLSGEHLTRAGVQIDQTGFPVVTLNFNKEGGKLFEQITERNIGNPVGIFLDGEAISTPNVNQKISGGQAIITGDFNILEAQDLARRLNSGALPVPIELISQQTVGAELGAESVHRSFIAGIIGIIAVIIFMIAFYRIPGIVAAFSLALYSAIIISIFKLVPVTLTLSGIAGFVLSIGLAVDANVLIFERMKEELRNGRTLQGAIDEGFKRAWESIRDGNISTLITAFILLWLGESLIKGFGVTLAIGVVVSMFSAITVTRVLLKLIARHGREGGFWWGVKR